MDNSGRNKTLFLGEADELSDGPSLQLMHDASPVDLDRLEGRPPFRSDLLVQHPFGYEMENFQFSGAKRLDPLLDLSDLSAFLILSFASCDRAFDGVQQVFFGERLGKEIDSALLHRFDTDRDAPVAADENDRDDQLPVCHDLLKSRAVQVWEADIQKQACGTFGMLESQKR